MLFSKGCQHAILAMTYLAEQEPGCLVSISEISEGAEIPPPFLAKIINTLSRHGLVSARRGPKGGVTLSRMPGEVTVSDIVAAIDGSLGDRRCVLGLSECSDKTPCPVHDNWKRVREQMSWALHDRTLADLVRAVKRKRGAPRYESRERE